MDSTLTAARSNAAYDWDAFDSAAYQQHNYASLRPDDARIIRIMRDWFDETVPASAHLEGVDVGTGSNLYPAFTLLPHCREITLWEFSAANVEWIGKQLVDLDESWAPFALTASRYDWAAARRGLPRVARVKQGSIFDLPRREWEIGTMGFVAESISGDPAEFERALGCFVGALKPGAPFAAAFMEGSEGYRVADRFYPAVALDEASLGATLDRLGVGALIQRVEIDPVPIRAGYSGYLTAVGRA